MRSVVWGIVRIILGIFGVRFETGTLTLLVDGEKSIQISTGFTPSNVWINPGQTVGVPVCQGDTDSFDVYIVPNGFVIIARLTSEYREIQWVARN